MSECELSPKARADLQEIWIFIAGENPVFADQLEADIYEACELLAKNPGLGHLRRDLTDKDVRFFLVRKVYLVVYLNQRKPIQIVRILHGTRDVESLL